MKKVCIGVGHGGADPGAVNGVRREADDNLRLALLAAECLRTWGHTAVLTRDRDQGSTPEQRRSIAIASGAGLFIDIHRNSFVNASAHGVELWVRSGAHREAAEAVLSEISRAPHQRIRGIFEGSYRVLHDMPMPAMLLEMGFISNACDNELFDAHLEEYAEAVARGALAALGVREPEGAGDSKLYRVQAGAFRSRENAGQLLKTMRGMGLDAFITTTSEGE